MPKNEFTEQEIAELVDEVRNSFDNEVADLLKSEEALAKASVSSSASSSLSKEDSLSSSMSKEESSGSSSSSSMSKDEDPSGKTAAKDNRVAQGQHVKGLSAQKQTSTGAPELVDEENSANSAKAHGWATKAEESASAGSMGSAFRQSVSKDESPPKKSPSEGSADSATSPAGSAAPSEGGGKDFQTPPGGDPGADPTAQGAPPPGGDPMGGDQMGGDQMGQMAAEKPLAEAYSELSDEDLHAHWEALKAVMMGRMGADEGVDQAPNPPPSMGVAQPMSTQGVPPPSGKAMTMSEKDEAGEKLAKAEEKIDELSKTVDKMSKLFEKMLSRPQPKAFSSLAEYQVVAKTEEEKAAPMASMTRGQIVAKLKEVTSKPELKKSDRDLVDGFLLFGAKPETIEHLLK